MASLMVIGGFDNRPRIGGNVLIKNETEGMFHIEKFLLYLNVCYFMYFNYNIEF